MTYELKESDKIYDFNFENLFLCCNSYRQNKSDLQNLY